MKFLIPKEKKPFKLKIPYSTGMVEVILIIIVGAVMFLGGLFSY